MRPEGSFVAERVAAQHCAELLRGTRKAVDPLKELAGVGEPLAAALERLIGDLCAGAKVVVRAGEPADLPANVANERRGEPMLNGMVALGAKEVMMIASVPQRAILSIVDLALGGTGNDCEVPAGKLPLSVQMMFGRFEKVVAAALVEGMGFADASLVKIKNAGPTLEAATPFAGCKRTVLSFEIGIAGTQPWEVSFVFPGSALTNLFANRAESADEAAAPASAAPGNPMAEPFSGIPLPLRAVLVDMAVPVSTLSRLRPGMVIPVQVARSVPLFAGDQVVAHGAVGEMDDRAALQLTKITASKEI